MAGVGQADRKISAGDFAAGVARIYFLGALPFEPHAEVEIGDDLGAGLVSDLERVANVVVMPVGEQNMRRAARGCAKMRGEIWVAGQEWVEQDYTLADLDAKGRMAEPGDFHGFFSGYMGLGAW